MNQHWGMTHLCLNIIRHQLWALIMTCILTLIAQPNTLHLTQIVLPHKVSPQIWMILLILFLILIIMKFLILFLHFDIKIIFLSPFLIVNYLRRYNQSGACSQASTFWQVECTTKNVIIK